MIDASQIKAGRAIAGLTQDDIAKATGLSVQTIKRMESVGTQRSSAGNVEAVKRAIEDAGVQFLEDGQVASGPGVALKKVGSE